MIASIKKTTFHRDVYEPAEVGCTSHCRLGAAALLAAAHLPHMRCTHRRP